MTDFRTIIPMRWPSGPLEVSRQSNGKGFNSRIRELLNRSHEPASLDILIHSPVNCLVLTWAAGLPEDAAQQKSASPLIEAAAKRGIAVLGWMEQAAEDSEATIAAARSAGLSGVVMSGYKGKLDYPVIACSDRAGVPWDSAAPALVITGNVWPGVQITAGSGDLSAGPTSLPWLDSNGWYVQMASARLPMPLWLAFDPPASGEIVLAQSYINAICDSEAAGGRWIISLDSNLRAGLMAGAASAQETWTKISSAVEFFQKHREWKSYSSLGCVGVISDFAGDNLDFSGEILNLMARRDLLFRVIWKSQALQQSFTGLKALVYADKEPPDPALRQKMLRFMEQGGLLVTNHLWSREGKPAVVAFDTQFEVLTHGKGKLAVARKELSDPYTTTVDVQLLLSYRNDIMKIYNGSSSGCSRFTAPPDGKKALLQMLSFASGRSAGLRTVWIKEKYRNARVWMIGAEPSVLQGERSEDYEGMEYHMPAATQQPYLGLEFEA